jgi:hypothetical protein
VVVVVQIPVARIVQALEHGRKERRKGDFVRFLECHSVVQALFAFAIQRFRGFSVFSIGTSELLKNKYGR